MPKLVTPSIKLTAFPTMNPIASRIDQLFKQFLFTIIHQIQKKAPLNEANGYYGQLVQRFLLAALCFHLGVQKTS